MITKEMIEDVASEHASSEYDQAAPWRWGGDLWTQSKESFKAGANWAIEQTANDAMQLLTWIAENGWHTSQPMWCNGEQSSDCDGSKSTYVELTSQELYQLYLKTKK